MRIVIEEARMNPKPYEVVMMNYTDFSNFKQLASQIVGNHNVDVDGKPVRFLNVKTFRFERGSTVIQYRYGYTGPFQSLDFLRKPPPKRKPRKMPPKKAQKKNPPFVIPENIFDNFKDRLYQLSLLYHTLQPISIEKKKDLMTLLKNNVIPQCYSGFQEALLLSKKVKDTFP